MWLAALVVWKALFQDFVNLQTLYSSFNFFGIDGGDFYFCALGRGAMEVAFTPALSADGAARWLRQMGLSDAANAVHAAGLDGADLAHCEAEDFSVIGVVEADATQIMVREMTTHAISVCVSLSPSLSAFSPAASMNRIERNMMELEYFVFMLPVWATSIFSFMLACSVCMHACLF